MSEEKVTRQHLKREAVIYVRQSSLLQVYKNQESKRRQYQLQEKAHNLGWAAARCVVIDDDQGISGAKAHNRPGYQKLISKIALREVGIVFGLEVSRLARNSRDWYELLELAAVFDVLIADEDGVYDVNQFNDRILLGLKGTISEVELYQIRTRFQRGRLNKAQRGELRLRLPVGMDWDTSTQRPRLAVDQSVRHSIELVFRLFDRIGSIRGVLMHCVNHDIELPYQVSWGTQRQIGWRRPSYSAVKLILQNPTYAGIYCYGKVKRHYDPISQRMIVERKSQDEWEVFMPDHHPGYITRQQFETNQQRIANNAFNNPNSPGAPRSGAALLQGIVYCHNCGTGMRVRYSSNSHYYVCDRNHRRFGEPICSRASAKRVDAQVADLLLSVLNNGTLEMSVRHAELLDQQNAELARFQQEKLQRLEYETTLARRRYEHVDPENRLVAATLEAEWNSALRQLETARKTFATRADEAYERKSTLAEMQHVLNNLRQIWFSADFPIPEQKALLRCVIERVVLTYGEKMIGTTIHWFGGAKSDLQVPKYLFSSPYIFWRVQELAKAHTDYEIAQILNDEGTKTVKGRPWSDRRVMDFRLSNQIASGFTTHPTLRLTESGFVTTPEAAKSLGVSISAIQSWVRNGILDVKDGTIAQRAIWIAWSPELELRLRGDAQPHPMMVSTRSLCKTRDASPPEVYQWAKQNGHQIYRLRRGSQFSFYILPAEFSHTSS